MQYPLVQICFGVTWRHSSGDVLKSTVTLSMVPTMEDVVLEVKTCVCSDILIAKLDSTNLDRLCCEDIMDHFPAPSSKLALPITRG